MKRMVADLAVTLAGEMTWELALEPVSGEVVVRVCANDAEGSNRWGLGSLAPDWPANEDLREDDLMNVDLF